MRHRCRVKKLSKPTDQRRALLRALTTELIRHGRITTTLIRAKVVRSEVDKMITLAKNGSLTARREALGYIYDKHWFTLCSSKLPLGMVIVKAVILASCIPCRVGAIMLRWQLLNWSNQFKSLVI